MRHRKPITALGLCALVAGPALAACNSASPPPPPRAEPIGTVSSELFANGDFETGTNGAAPPSWTVTTNQNRGVTIQHPQTRDGLNLKSGGTAKTVILTSTGPETKWDPDLGDQASLRWPKFGKNVAIVNQKGKDYNVNSLKQTMTVGADDIDSVDGLAHIRFVVAPVLQDPNHSPDEQPYFFVQLTNLTKGKLLYQDFNFANQAGVPWKQVGEIKYTDWALVDIAPGSADLAPGDKVELEVIAAGCSQSGHWGHVYVDGVGPTVPGIFVSATGPSAANEGTDITYVLTYKNGGENSAGGVVVEFNMPPHTTFTSVSPPPGVTCTPPATQTGTVSCTVGALAAGASGSFPVTVHIDNGTAGSVITAGDYSIKGTNISPLLGPKVYTDVTKDVTYANLGITMNGGAATAPAGGTVTYVIEVTNKGPSDVEGATVTDTLPSLLLNATWTCTPSTGAMCTLSGSGNLNDSQTSIPVGGKLTYTITATVAPTATAGQLANIASVDVPEGATDPDPKDNSVGDYKQITAANGTSCSANADCTSGVCPSSDHKCGLPNGEGPCDAANGSTVCRSRACSTNETCMPAGGCNVDGDCDADSWCHMGDHQCKPKAANSAPVGTDPAHTPTLDGSCTEAAGALTCLSGVCDADNHCGYAEGTGPCTSANAGVRCRSGACSFNGTCMPPAGCNDDRDCVGGKWCNISAHECTDKVANGQPVPTDSGHTAPVSPVLDGTCRTDAAALTCASGVCDEGDNRCGYANGTGLCTGSDASTVCRSGACSSDGTCRPAGGCNADADCTGGKWCNVSEHECTDKLANGDVVPTDASHTDPTLDGKCTTQAATLTCVSGVCDTTDHRCGYADGTGPCTAGNGGLVCRSGSCSATGVCKPVTACNVDSDCDASHYCDTGAHVCTAKVPNGSPMPAVKDHKPALDGTCSPEAAAVVCQSGVCDPSDDKCGYSNGAGPCSVANAATICRSGACDPNDEKCGLADDHGPCSSDIVCRSSRCNTEKRVCGPSCKTDNDCADSEYCKSDGTCSLKRPNGDQCASSNQCQSGACEDEVCDSLVASGNGLACAVRTVNGSNEGAGAAAFGMMLAAVGLFRKRRSGRRSSLS